jgi:hypothetical protein
VTLLQILRMITFVYPDDLYNLPEWHGLIFFQGAIDAGPRLCAAFSTSGTIRTWRADTIPIPITGKVAKLVLAVRISPKGGEVGCEVPQ